jgi:TPR repeat protein
VGDGIPMNKSRAAYYFMLSADQGNPRAQFMHGAILYDGDGISSNKSLAAQYFKLSADRGLLSSQLKYAKLHIDGDVDPISVTECEKYLRLAVAQGSPVGQMQLGLCLLSGFFGRFDFTKARELFDNLSESNPLAAVLRDAISSSDDDLVDPSEFFRNGNLFSVLRWSSDADIPLVRILNADLCNFALDNTCCFAAWQQTAD